MSLSQKNNQHGEICEEENEHERQTGASSMRLSVHDMDGLIVRKKGLSRAVHALPASQSTTLNKSSMGHKQDNLWSTEIET